MKIWDRKNKKYYEEKEYGKEKLEFLYSKLVGRILLRTIFASRWFSKLISIYQKSRFSKHKISGFIIKYNVNMEEYGKLSKYNSFAEFFTRKRKIENMSKSDELVAIADSKLQVFDISDDLKLNIKNSVYTISELILNDELAKDYKNGICLVFRLSMDDYHRYVFLDDGQVINRQKIKGKLHTIRPISSKYNVFCRNSREITVLSTSNFKEVIQVEVGAMLTGKIENNNLEKFKKLDEKGYFDFGGSTIILLLKKDVVSIDDDILYNSNNDIETKVEVGMKIGNRRI